MAAVMNTWNRYSAWCCRRARSAQCSPGAIAIPAGLALCVIAGVGVNNEAHRHLTGIMQVVAGVLAACVIGTAIALIWGALRLMDRWAFRVSPELDVPLPEPAVLADLPEPAAKADDWAQWTAEMGAGPSS